MTREKREAEMKPDSGFLEGIKYNISFFGGLFHMILIYYISKGIFYQQKVVLTSDEQIKAHLPS